MDLHTASVHDARDSQTGKNVGHAKSLELLSRRNIKNRAGCRLGVRVLLQEESAVSEAGKSLHDTSHVPVPPSHKVHVHRHHLTLHYLQALYPLFQHNKIMRYHDADD
jgi:hypothetical protein